MDDVRLSAACNAPIRVETAEMHLNGDNNIQIFYLRRYIVGYTCGNQVLWLLSHVAVKLNFPPYIRRYTSPNENFEYSYPLKLMQFCTDFIFLKCTSKIKKSIICSYFSRMLYVQSLSTCFHKVNMDFIRTSALESKSTHITNTSN